MQWFEYIIIVVAVFLVILPIILKIRAKKTGKGTCSCECCSKSQCASCPMHKEKKYNKKLAHYNNN